MSDTEKGPRAEGLPTFDDLRGLLPKPNSQEWLRLNRDLLAAEKRAEIAEKKAEQYRREAATLRPREMACKEGHVTHEEWLAQKKRAELAEAELIHLRAVVRRYYEAAMLVGNPPVLGGQHHQDWRRAHNEVVDAGNRAALSPSTNQRKEGL